MHTTRVLTHALVVGVLAGGALAPATPAGAAKPQKIAYSDTFSFLAEDYCDVEGLEVQIDGLVEGVLKIHDRNGLEYWTDKARFTVVHSLGENSVTVVSQEFWKDLHVEDLGDTLVITFFGTGPLSVYGADGKAIARNPGQVRFRVTIDKATDEELEFEVLKESTGRNDDFCSAVLPVLQG